MFAVHDCTNRRFVTSAQCLFRNHWNKRNRSSWNMDEHGTSCKFDTCDFRVRRKVLWFFLTPKNMETIVLVTDSCDEKQV
ncbi:hypothetical protein ACE6H2_007154 [Prunus campanulata]